MTNFVPIFPLALVVYPGESLNLHIFEPRYKQLIRECVQAHKPFGVPTMIHNELKEYGTLLEISSIKKEYDNGELDIVTQGIKVFRVLEVISEVPDKLFSGAIVHYPPNHAAGNPALMNRIIHGVRKLHSLMGVDRKFHKPDHDLKSYDIAHVLGLTLEEEYEVLGLFQERQRQEYLRLHLEKMLPLMAGMERVKKRIQLNGHFQRPKSGGFKKK